MDSFQELKEKVKEKMNSERRTSAHDFAHIERVLKNAEVIGKIEGADMEIVRYAALFHDYVRGAEHEEKENHALLSAEAAESILLKYLPKEKVEKISKAIKAHSRRSKVKPESMEEKVIYDADKLDLSGAVGVARYLIQGEELGWSIRKVAETYLKRARRILEEGNWCYTETGKKMVEKRIQEGLRICEELIEQT